MNERPDNGDDPRDAHLLAALRHAPDRDALPPRELSERILEAARAAVRPAPWWTRLGAWLTQPQVAAAFGTLAVASLVGVMWSTREPPVVEPQASAERFEPRPADAQPAPAAAAAETAAPDVAAPPPQTPLPAPVAKEAKARAEARARTDRLAETPAAKVAVPPAAERRSNSSAADSALMARREAVASGAPSAAAPSAVGAAAASLADKAADPLAPADALLAAAQGRWSSGGPALPHGAAQAAWWAQFKAATAGAWTQQPPAPERQPAPWLRLVADGRGVASIDLDADTVLWCPVDRRACWRAPITAAQREAWTAEVARW